MYEKLSVKESAFSDLKKTFLEWGGMAMTDFLRYHVLQINPLKNPPLPIDP